MEKNYYKSYAKMIEDIKNDILNIMKNKLQMNRIDFEEEEIEDYKLPYIAPTNNDMDEMYILPGNVTGLSILDDDKILLNVKYEVFDDNTILFGTSYEENPITTGIQIIEILNKCINNRLNNI